MNLNIKTYLSKWLMTALMFTMVLGFGSTQLAHANTGGFGVSGSFSNYHYRMVPGETIETPDVNVIFFNNYSVDIQVEITAVGPDGVDFLLESTLVGIPARTDIVIPIGISVDENAEPGEYILGLSARVIPEATGGIQVVGAAELRTRLSIFGEAGDLRVEAFDVLGNPFLLRLSLFRVDGNTLQPVDESLSGVLQRRYVPGQYRVYAYYLNEEVGRIDITLNDGDSIVERIVAQTVFIDAFTVTPQFSNDTEEFTTARLRYTVRNIYITLEDIRIGLRVRYIGNEIDNSEVMALPLLPEGSFNGNFTYVPPTGWAAGLYEFQLFAYFGEFEDVDPEDVILLATSRVRDLDVPSDAVDPEDPVAPVDPDPSDPDPVDPDPFDPDVDSETNNLVWFIIAGVALITLFFIFFLLFRRSDLDAVEYAEKRMRKEGIDKDSDHFLMIIELVKDEMKPGTDFHKKSKGEKEYYKEVEKFLIKNDAFDPQN